MAISRGSIDRDPRFSHALACRIDVFHLIGEVSEITSARVVLGIPVVSQFHLNIRILWSAKKDEGEASRLYIDAALLDESEVVAVEIEGCLEIRDPNHGVEVTHRGSVDDVGEAGQPYGASLRLSALFDPLGPLGIGRAAGLGIVPPGSGRGGRA